MFADAEQGRFGLPGLPVGHGANLSHLIPQSDLSQQGIHEDSDILSTAGFPAAANDGSRLPCACGLLVSVLLRCSGAGLVTVVGGSHKKVPKFLQASLHVTAQFTALLEPLLRFCLQPGTSLGSLPLAGGDLGLQVLPKLGHRLVDVPEMVVDVCDAPERVRACAGQVLQRLRHSRDRPQQLTRRGVAPLSGAASAGIHRD
jgi:hypothetical protein